MSRLIHAYKNDPTGKFTVRLVRRLNVSTSGVGRLTHTGIVGRMVVNIVVDPTKTKPIADMTIHRADNKSISYGVTTDSPADLRAAAQALREAAVNLEHAQELAERRD